MPLFTLPHVMPKFVCCYSYVEHKHNPMNFWRIFTLLFFFTITVHIELHLSSFNKDHEWTITAVYVHCECWCGEWIVIWCLVWRIDQNLGSPLKISAYSNWHVAFGYSSKNGPQHNAHTKISYDFRRLVIWQVYFSNIVPLGVLGKLPGIFRAFLSHC